MHPFQKQIHFFARGIVFMCMFRSVCMYSMCMSTSVNVLIINIFQCLCHSCWGAGAVVYTSVEKAGLSPAHSCSRSVLFSIFFFF